MSYANLYGVVVSGGMLEIGSPFLGGRLGFCWEVGLYPTLFPAIFLQQIFSEKIS
jgi:hypothetical protein